MPCFGGIGPYTTQAEACIVSSLSALRILPDISPAPRRLPLWQFTRVRNKTLSDDCSRHCLKENVVYCPTAKLLSWRGSALMMAAERRKKPKILIRRDRYSPPARPGVPKDVPFGGPPRGLGSGADPRSAAMLI